MNKIKILIVLGTRPEAIKLASFIKVVSTDADCLSVVCATGQHREMQNEVLSLFGITPNYDLDVMIEGQDLFYLTTSILEKIKVVLEKEKPDYIVVQGDTTTAFISTLAGFYKKIPVIHIEAGLRTYDILSPFPEEANRRLISNMATFHMAPTQKAIENLSNEGITKNVFKTGNIIVDSIDWVLKNVPVKDFQIKKFIENSRPKVLITVHRRENFGNPLKNICTAINKLVDLYQNYDFIWPIHPNPNVKSVIEQFFDKKLNLYFTNPLPYPALLKLINSSTIVLSDSGGIQEECCVLGKPILVLRDSTERTEVIEEKIGVLVGTNKEKIVLSFQNIVSVQNLNFSPSNVYGDAGVCQTILSIIKKSYC